MSKIFLCGHTGSENRGCEAIVRSTVEILNQIGINDVQLVTFAQEQDRRSHLDKIVNLIPYFSYPSRITKYIAGARRIAFDDYYWGKKIQQRNLICMAEKGDVFFNIGGDTYCYDRPLDSYALNQTASNMGISTVFWGCSLDERVYRDSEMRRDLDSYSYIVSRETLSYKVTQENVSVPKKVFIGCDPAFHLRVKETELPEKFWDGNTVGINISPMVMKDADFENSITYKNVIRLIEDVISNTQMQICLIPHVYNVERNTQDIQVLKVLYNHFMESGRVSIVAKELSCEELKYIISKCRFFIGARTHSTIAAYSTGVPTIALSYSIKSRGIAKDLFGTEEGYAVPFENLKNDTDLLNCFEQLMHNEGVLRKRYEDFLPEYKQSIIMAASKILEKLKFNN